VPRPAPRYGRLRYWSPHFPVAAETPATRRCYHTRPSADDDPKCLNAPAACSLSLFKIRIEASIRTTMALPTSRSPTRGGGIRPCRARSCTGTNPRRHHPVPDHAPQPLVPQPGPQHLQTSITCASRYATPLLQITRTGIISSGSPRPTTAHDTPVCPNWQPERSHASGRRHSWLATHRVSGHRCGRS
jgi:hypothetical protein